MAKLEDSDLLYSATARCSCGAGLAYPLDHDEAWRIQAWVCARVLKGEVAAETVIAPLPFGLSKQASATGSHDSFHWSMYKIREETSINNSSGISTRPAGTIARTLAKATCPQCSHKWQSEPYDATAARNHWESGPCPSCGYEVRCNGKYSTADGKFIDVRFTDVVIRTESA